jgi:hypothetical protein
MASGRLRAHAFLLHLIIAMDIHEFVVSSDGSRFCTAAAAGHVQKLTQLSSSHILNLSATWIGFWESLQGFTVDGGRAA